VRRPRQFSSNDGFDLGDGRAPRVDVGGDDPTAALTTIWSTTWNQRPHHERAVQISNSTPISMIWAAGILK
jgi:hypothetical protein